MHTAASSAGMNVERTKRIGVPPLDSSAAARATRPAAPSNASRVTPGQYCSTRKVDRAGRDVVAIEAEAGHRSPGAHPGNPYSFAASPGADRTREASWLRERIPSFA